MKNRPVRGDEGRANPFLKDNNKKYLTDPVFLIGNGKSRDGFDLERLRRYGTIIGCNAIYREFAPDVLLAIDGKMLKEIGASDYPTEEKMVVTPANRAVVIKGSYKFRSDRFNTCGCFAMHLISRCIKPSKCYMIGMDSYPGNMYDGTVNYAPNTLQNFSGVGQYYLKALKGEGDTTFVNVNVKDAWPPECQNEDTYEYMPFEEFEQELNSGNFNKE